MNSTDFAYQIIKWYKKNKRVLPWRKTKDPYVIWISEIILQQTKVNQGLPYFNKFIDSFPDINTLAKSNEETILKLWQGLGYYSRARNLHFTAKFIVNELNGVFPNNYDELIKLKGIGKYTAAAISSFAFNEKKAVVDGNVYRILSRYHKIKAPIDSTIGQKLFEQIATDSLPKKNHSLYNQAIMDFGALQCIPKNPNCQCCPLKPKCIAYGEKVVGSFPFKTKKNKIKKRWFNFFVITDRKFIYLEKRTENDIWRNLYQFPMIEQKLQTPNPFENLTKKAIHSNNLSRIHLLSHQKINANFWSFELDFLPKNKNYLSVKVESLKNYPVPKIVENFINENLLVKH